VNGDRKPDIVVSNCGVSFEGCYGVSAQGYVAVLLGNGDGTFQSPVGYNSGAVSANAVAIADVNGDGEPDIVVANTCKSNQSGRCTGPGEATVLLGNGDGTFKEAVPYASGGKTALSVALADVNGDGRPDLIAVNEAADSVGVLLNKTLYATQTLLVSSRNPSQVNQSVAFTATVTSNPAIPNGSTVVYSQGKVVLGSALTSNGVATLTTSFSKAGKYAVKASYSGDSFHKPSSGSVKQVVNP